MGVGREARQVGACRSRVGHRRDSVGEGEGCCLVFSHYQITILSSWASTAVRVRVPGEV